MWVVHLRIKSMQLHAVKTNGQKKSSYTSGIAMLLFLWFSILQLVPQSRGQQNPEPAGQLRGTAFISDSNGQSYIANAKVTLEGPTVMETETDESGKFEFRDVQPGTYTIEVTTPGLIATQSRDRRDGQGR